MSLFRPITAQQDLPPTGVRSEDHSIDAKLKLSTKFGSKLDTIEWAKDVAAFANTLGGTILIGADQDSATKCITYAPISGHDAQHAAKSYEDAARDRCRPPPLVSAAVLAKDGGYVAAVNVWAMPGQAVGVRVTQEKQTNGTGEDTYLFPVRVGSSTAYVQPSQLAMLMLPEVRRIAILLEAMGKTPFLLYSDTQSETYLDGRRLTRQDLTKLAFVVEAVSPMTNGLFVRAKIGALERVFCIPLDHVITAYKFNALQWIVVARGKVHLSSGKGHNLFIPTDMG